VRQFHARLLLAFALLASTAPALATTPGLTGTSSAACERPIVREAPGIFVAGAPTLAPMQPLVPEPVDALDAFLRHFERAPRLALGLGGLMLLLGLFFAVGVRAWPSAKARLAWSSALAFAPFVAGLGVAVRIRFALVESATQPGYCVPRGLIAELGAIDVQDALFLGLLASAPLLWATFVVMAIHRGSGRWLALPALPLVVCTLATWGLQARLGYDRDAVDAGEKIAARIDALPGTTRTSAALPDLPVVTIDARGVAVYTELWQGHRPERPPVLFRPERGRTTDEASPPSLILAVDRATPFSAIHPALRPLVEQGHGHYELALANADRHATVSVDLFPQGPPRVRQREWGWPRFLVVVEDETITFYVDHDEVGRACEVGEPGPTFTGWPSAETLRECAVTLRRWSYGSVGARVWIQAAPETPFSRVAAVADALTDNGLFGNVSIVDEVP
jgi:hypothetical protein